MISKILIVLSDTEEILNSDSDEENKLLYLTKTGYSEVEASIAMERCGPDSSIAELNDFICAAQMAKATDTLLPDQRKLEKKLLNQDDHAVHLLNSMIGLRVPTKPNQITQRTLLEDAIGPPYFYYENMELAPVGVWTEISRKCQIDRKIRKALEAYDDESPLSVQKYVLDECQKWNLVWVGRNKVVPLKPDEVKMLLSFNVLSLFSGISDTEVTFYWLGIPLKTDVQEMNIDQLEQLMSRFHEFDLVIPLAYSTFPESWKGLVDGNTGYLNFWNPVTNVHPYERLISVESVSMSYSVPYVLNFKFSNLLKDIMDIILSRKLISMEEAAMMYQDLS
ncbi:DNA (Cytosine-5)-methyltransferase DRM1/2 isoform 4 [Hibiscus syriacus]|uniref:DNA (Cytosine-5)-methyltransferase DRM1/2 isoform 4 n=1 Tax=Hibiscus syriacus TaxID=106335 RepID=A0A6A3CZ26_HIBSY|nr:DNA (Cytosine-5)-methyltransferase DRM1/2 isoform 4 [Hibiscus syriacus]